MTVLCAGGAMMSDISGRFETLCISELQHEKTTMSSLPLSTFIVADNITTKAAVMRTARQYLLPLPPLHQGP